MTDTKICKICGAEFTPKTGQQRYCSIECREVNRRKMGWERRHDKPWVIDPYKVPRRGHRGLDIERHSYRADDIDKEVRIIKVGKLIVKY